MPSERPYTGTRLPQDSEYHRPDIPHNYGIYIGEVVEIDTVLRIGRLKVVIEGQSTTQTRYVNHANPYFGFTDANPIANSPNPIESMRTSYGFSIPTPEVGNYVLCLFPNNNKNSDGYWIASVNKNKSIYSVPAHGASLNYEATKIDNRLKPFIKAGSGYPVTESPAFEQKTVNSPSFLRPVNPLLTDQLLTQGLLYDKDRGTITSSVQREAVNSIVGFNTPGRPIPSQDTKFISNIKRRLFQNDKTLEKDIKPVTARLAGHSFVMDDGDAAGENNLVRWRTAAGHQILMNDTLGFIYISNATGNSWVELTGDGNILIYGAKDFCLRTQGSIQLHSDTEIVMDSPKIKMLARETMELESNDLMSLKSHKNLHQYAKDTMNITSENQFEIHSEGTIRAESIGRMDLFGNKLNLNSGIGQRPQKIIPDNIPEYKLPDNNFTTTDGWTTVADKATSICTKIPTHEPYSRISIAKIIEQRQQIAEKLKADPNVSETVKNQLVKVPPKSAVLAASASATGSVTGAVGAVTGAVGAVTGAVGAVTGAVGAVTDGLSVSGMPSVVNAVNKANKNIAPVSSFKTQPDPGKGLGSLSKENVQAMFAQIGHTESSGNYIPIDKESPVAGVNRLGYIGKYQLGSDALQDLGYVKPGTPQTVEALSNPNNWIGGNGKPANLDEFLQNGQHQENAMYEHTKNNYETLQKLGVIRADTNPQEISGLLTASHIGGADGVKKWIATGSDPADAFGTKISDYYNNGVASQQIGVQVIVATETSKTQLGG